ncbi:MAG: ATP-binding protein [Phenylobacterium sp.]|uniref:ATP-binding protein n=1 Tax=Phenylobacterium sp. TaxID=1871053 RepID=UPI00391C44EE
MSRTGEEAPQPSGWLQVVAYRRRDRLIIVPMSVVAAGGAAVWLGPGFAAIWLAANLILIGLSARFCAWIGAKREPDDRWELALAAAALVNTGAYCSLPLALIGQAAPMPMLAGAAMLAAVAMSSTDEFVLSRRIGGASLLISGVAGVVGLLSKAPGHSWFSILLALIAVIAFFAYVLQAALKRERVERAMAQALVRAVEKEQEAAIANAAKSTFLATMSHEIRTPLNGVLGMAQAMATDELSPAQRERLEILRKSGASLTAILNDVLDLSKIEAGRLELEQIPFDLEETLEAVSQVFAALAREKGLAFEAEIGEAARGRYRGDPTRLRQIVFNLISNALKFTAEGAIRVVADQVDGRLRIGVSDTGPGIGPEQQARLFGKFVQLDASITRRHGGTGLGLAICQELCALMGGEISVESALGRGSAFTVVLPLEKLPDAGPERRAAEPVFGISGRPLRVLAAEDNEVNQAVLKALLGAVGIEPVFVPDGLQAVEAWAAAEWDLVLMDMQMPVMDGESAIREIRAREAAAGLRPTPVIALTADTLAHQVAALRAAGADEHVAKPIELPRLLQAMAEILDRSPPAAAELAPQAVGSA